MFLLVVIIKSGRQRERAAEGVGPSRRLRADRRGLLRAGQGVRPGAPHRLLQDLPLPRLHPGAHRHRDGLNTACKIHCIWSSNTSKEGLSFKFEHWIGVERGALLGT